MQRVIPTLRITACERSRSFSAKRLIFALWLTGAASHRVSAERGYLSPGV
jgi:hypothetical protein